MAQPHQSPYLLDVIGWYPRLRKPVYHHKIPQVPGVEAIGLGPLLGPLQGLGLRRLGQVRLDSGALHLLDDVAPAGGGLHGDGDLLTGEPLCEPIEPLSEALAVGGTDLASVYFAAVDLYVVEGDLLPMHVESTYNVHFRGSSSSVQLTQHGYGLTIPASELGRPHFIEPLPGAFSCHLFRQFLDGVLGRSPNTSCRKFATSSIA